MQIATSSKALIHTLLKVPVYLIKDLNVLSSFTVAMLGVFRTMLVKRRLFVKFLFKRTEAEALIK